MNDQSCMPKIKSRTLHIMEVCGTHTMAISKYGIRQLLPQSIDLISGPGCPVCVTSIHDIDRIIKMVENYDLTVFTFGDLIRVPGTASSLMHEKSKGKDIRICYSPMSALDFAKKNPHKKVLFLSIGFETTVPISAVLAIRAKEAGCKNFMIYCANKLIVPALRTLLSDKDVHVDALLLPGHVCAITGSKPYGFIPRQYKIPSVISGFEPKDILESIEMLLAESNRGNPSKVLIQYKSVVRPEGNKTAMGYIYDVFKQEDSIWRGLGLIPQSGLGFKERFLYLDAKTRLPVGEIRSEENPSCRCGDVLKGIIKPDGCRLFSKTCTPQNPLGPCMVSSEGACAAHFKYEKEPIH